MHIYEYIFWIHHPCKAILFPYPIWDAESIWNKMFLLSQLATSHPRCDCICVPTNTFNVRRQRSHKIRIARSNKYNPPWFISERLWWLTQPISKWKEIRGEEVSVSPWPVLWQRFTPASIYNPSKENDKSEGSLAANILSGDSGDKTPLPCFMAALCSIYTVFCVWQEPLFPPTLLFSLWIRNTNCLWHWMSHSIKSQKCLSLFLFLLILSVEVRVLPGRLLFHVTL